MYVFFFFFGLRRKFAVPIEILNHHTVPLPQFGSFFQIVVVVVDDDVDDVDDG